MTETFASACVDAFLAYVAIGAAFAAWFVIRGVDRIDPVARGSSRGFRAMIFPGCVALWPVLLRKVLRGGKPRA